MTEFQLERIENASTGELRVLQLERLRAQLKHAYCRVIRYVRIADMGAVERSIGKAKRVIDKRPKV